ncbi:hypothetical protein D8674_017374 [Pyrus ussuriensis x Pyrus communis]|uniref:Uncharacterized protein n=1 Tax=Pyrus ussuriensis x Pyrus communis TaxID=2448454 RepID=A0A5N5HQS9_9ROSA|nr:hypothetical protein D8674_017374 [Pyrus ussuriensis x Pyrus communis]
MDVVFLTKKHVVHVESDFLRHVRGHSQHPIIFWERIKGLKSSPNLCRVARSCFVIDLSSYMLEKLSLTCRWFGKVPREKRDFLELLDDVSSFVFHPYIALLEVFKLMMFYTDVVYGEDSSMTQIPLSKNLDFPSLYEKSLALLASSVPSLGENGPEWVAYPRNLVFCGLDGKVKHFRPKVAKDGHPNSRKFITFSVPKEPNSKSASKKLKIETALAGFACRTRCSRAFTSFGAPKQAGYLDTSSSSKEDHSTNGAANDDELNKDLEATESSNSSVDSELKSRRCPQVSLREGMVGVDDNAGSSDRSDSKVIGDDNFNELDFSLNDDV